MGKRTHLQYIIFMWRLLLIISTNLAGNSIGKFRLSIKNFQKYNITNSANKVGSGVLSQAFNRYM